jgi:fructose-bisphosphate aldolase class II
MVAREVSNRSYITPILSCSPLPLAVLAKRRGLYKKDELTHVRFLVFHGGSGSTKDEIREAVVNGVVKMNVDTDTQWAYLTGIRDFVLNKKDYLMTQVGNPEGADKPNKKQYVYAALCGLGSARQPVDVDRQAERLGKGGKSLDFRISCGNMTDVLQVRPACLGPRRREDPVGPRQGGVPGFGQRQQELERRRIAVDCRGGKTHTDVYVI